MTPSEFIATWKNNSLSEKGGAQPHFEDLCRLLNVAPPRERGEYCYEQDLEKMLGGKGFADVWKRGCFAWENKGPDKDLGPALMQLKNYAGALDNPPVLVVCNRERIEIHPCFTGYPSTPRIIRLEEIGELENLQALRWLFSPRTSTSCARSSPTQPLPLKQRASSPRSPRPCASAGWMASRSRTS